MVHNIRFHDAVDTIQATFHIRTADSVAHMIDRKLFTTRRLLTDINIVHTFNVQRDGSINLHDDVLGVFYEQGQVTHAGTQDKISIFSNCGSFHNGYIYITEETVIHLLAKMT